MSGNQGNQVWIGGKLKLSISRPVPFFIVRDFGFKLRARGSSAKSITLSTVFGIFISEFSNLSHV
ncbi:ATP-dependent RNA helicase A [Gossypium arboreum]|uniref:ATP-dependent RNA helicase A n=1 Tax=Gossypium arboreum TaxID=29729 RepID=A0A0B0MCA5_GOSAR|nr:ATP-dependent RNA helicase A [Gossypium arboreum]